MRFVALSVGLSFGLSVKPFPVAGAAGHWTGMGRSADEGTDEGVNALGKFTSGLFRITPSLSAAGEAVSPVTSNAATSGHFNAATIFCVTHMCQTSILSCNKVSANRLKRFCCRTKCGVTEFRVAASIRPLVAALTCPLTEAGRSM